MSELLNCIVYVTAFMFLVCKIQYILLDFNTPHKGVSHDQIPFAARLENTHLCNTSSDSDTTNIQLFCPYLLHNDTNALGRITNITNDCASANTSGYLDLVQRLEFGVDHLQKNAVYQIE